MKKYLFTVNNSTYPFDKDGVTLTFFEGQIQRHSAHEVGGAEKYENVYRVNAWYLACQMVAHDEYNKHDIICALEFGRDYWFMFYESEVEVEVIDNE